MSNTNINSLWYETLVGKKVVEDKYLHEGESTFDDLVNRVSAIFSEHLKEPMREAMINGDFFVAGRSLYGAGSKGKFKATLSNCYILPMPEDNIESIFDTNKEMARVFSMGGGAGVNLSKLRPRGAKVNNSAKTSTGAVSFMSIFDSVGNVIGSNNRRAALIMGLNCDHPDIEEFLEVKQNNTAIQSANISILFTDNFMKAVENDEDFELYYKVEETGEEIVKRINAREFFMKFAEANHDYAEPGALFIDKVRNYNILAHYPAYEYRIDISNPCAEFVGNAYNSCNLASINLYNIVDDPFTDKAKINFEKLANLTRLGVEVLDEVLDYGYDLQPLKQNKKCIDDWRAVGLGIFGLAEMFIALGVRYGSKESEQYTKQVMNTFANTAYETSALLAKEKGTFQKYNADAVLKSPLMDVLDPKVVELIKKHGLRNGSLLSIAPTGTISTMCGCSGGIEPLFAISYERTTHALSGEGKFFKVFAKSVEHLLLTKGINPETISTDKIKELFPYVVTAHDISPIERINVQSVIQKYIDNAISSTVNMDNNATVEDVFNAYLYAWKKGCKGLTIFRNGCKRTAILVTDDSKKDEPEEDITPSKFDYIFPVKSDEIGEEVEGTKVIKHTACVKNMYNHVYAKDGNIVEVFTSTSQKGGCTSNISTITRLASLALRSGVKVSEVINEMKATSCAGCIKLREQGKEDVSNSCGTAIAEAIEKAYNRFHNNAPIEKEDTEGLLICPNCGKRTLRSEGRCFSCHNCLYSKCE